MTNFDIVSFLEQSVQIPSHDDVDEMRTFLVDTLTSHGFEPSVDSAGNTITTRGTGSPHIVLNTHIDTVPPYLPFHSDSDMVYGRGACDAKGPLAAFVYAFIHSNPSGKLTLAITPDEELTSRGANALHFDDVPDAFIVGEPTNLEICNASKGRFEANIVIKGENAHAAESHLTNNVIDVCVSILAALKTFDKEQPPGTETPLGSPLLTPTIIKSGNSSNQIPSTCEITVDRRSVPPESADSFKLSLESHLKNHIPDWATLSISLSERETPFLGPFFTSEDSNLVKCFQQISGTKTRPFTAASEASYFSSIAPTVIFGPGVLTDSTGAVAHSSREYVTIAEVKKAAHILTDVISKLGL
tara:strand:+ start:645 stop:1718 length:1074 start_codon:yes stop_codon:yes gene_type:complete